MLIRILVWESSSRSNLMKLGNWVAEAVPAVTLINLSSSFFSEWLASTRKIPLQRRVSTQVWRVSPQIIVHLAYQTTTISQSLLIRETITYSYQIRLTHNAQVVETSSIPTIFMEELPLDLWLIGQALAHATFSSRIILERSQAQAKAFKGWTVCL